jgi:hypothetical protein
MGLTKPQTECSKFTPGRSIEDLLVSKHLFRNSGSDMFTGRFHGKLRC